VGITEQFESSIALFNRTLGVDHRYGMAGRFMRISTVAELAHRILRMFFGILNIQHICQIPAINVNPWLPRDVYYVAPHEEKAIIDLNQADWKWFTESTERLRTAEPKKQPPR
jgi:hypothetical protein